MSPADSALNAAMPSARAKPARAPRTFEGICDRIRGQIAAGQLKEGDKLPAEREMAEQWGVGRNAVREALRSLEMAGVVRLEKGRNGGAFIRPANASRVTHAFRDLLDYGSISWAEFTEARMLLLDTVVRLACERGTEADFAALVHNVDEMEALTRAGLYDERTARATEFHRLLAACTHNGMLVLLVTSMTDLLRRFVEMASEDGRRPMENLVAKRRRFLKLLAARDAERAAADWRRQLLEIHELMQPKLASRPLPAAAVRAKRAR